MRSFINLVVVALLAETSAALPWKSTQHTIPYRVDVGERPYYIINNMTNGPLKDSLVGCENNVQEITEFTIGHRGGGTLQFPEETVESTMAGARMGAGILECDVSFTKDRGLVCRHSLCDLHTTTNILLHPDLAAKCSVSFTPANATSPANAVCCTSDITTAEYLTLCGKQDGFNSSAKNVKDYQYGTPTWRTELYDTCGTVMTLESYITLVDSLPGYRNFTPELKTPPAPYVIMPFNGYTQEQYARDMLDTFKNRSINPSRVYAQSFNPPDIFQWIKEYPDFAKQAIYLTEDGDTPATLANATTQLAGLAAQGVKIIGPPFGYLLTTTPDNQTIIPSAYANAAKAAGLDIIAWTFERSGPLALVASTEEYYYTQIAQGIHYDGQLYDILDVLARHIGIRAIFSDWAATVTYYANCLL
ncbi:related to glycerophosphoryl diester phosphodiesterase family protein [Phialocephala subalpina]|uniref:glycerophosphodiester phosphodiesterase n=1 Tax=Phialocephala subalpina TaxID=576137 RepID=A0A1L7WC16_9HELO|nr:related to glycerophosphoryl diester phosphodiesterase family protein [Phialocephala subalpina]